MRSVGSKIEILHTDLVSCKAYSWRVWKQCSPSVSLANVQSHGNTCTAVALSILQLVAVVKSRNAEWKNWFSRENNLFLVLTSTKTTRLAFGWRVFLEETCGSSVSHLYSTENMHDWCFARWTRVHKFCAKLEWSRVQKWVFYTNNEGGNCGNISCYI